MDVCMCRESLETALMDMDQDRVFQLSDDALEMTSVKSYIDEIVVEVLKIIGEKWEKGIVSLAQIYMSGIICEELINRILPVDKVTNEVPAKIAIATLEDHHVLGKKIVMSVLKSGGIQFYDYGNGVDVMSLVEKVKQDEIEILLISVLMYSSALKVKEVREELEKTNYQLKILVGGAPFQFDQSLWKQVKADGMGNCATDALDYIKKWTIEGRDQL